MGRFLHRTPPNPRSQRVLVILENPNKNHPICGSSVIGDLIGASSSLTAQPHLIRFEITFKREDGNRRSRRLSCSHIHSTSDIIILLSFTLQLWYTLRYCLLVLK